MRFRLDLYIALTTMILATGLGFMLVHVDKVL